MSNENLTIEIEQTPVSYIVELMKDGELDTVLCTREFYEDAKSDACWYKDNEYPEADLKIANFDRLFFNLELIRDEGYELTESERKVINEAHYIIGEVQRQENDKN